MDVGYWVIGKVSQHGNNIAGRRESFLCKAVSEWVGVGKLELQGGMPPTRAAPCVERWTGKQVSGQPLSLLISMPLYLCSISRLQDFHPGLNF